MYTDYESTKWKENIDITHKGMKTKDAEKRYKFIGWCPDVQSRETCCSSLLPSTRSVWNSEKDSLREEETQGASRQPRVSTLSIEA